MTWIKQERVGMEKFEVLSSILGREEKGNKIKIDAKVIRTSNAFSTRYNS